MHPLKRIIDRQKTHWFIHARKAVPVREVGWALIDRDWFLD